MNKMIVANLVHRPVRSLISIVAIALEVTLILLIVGLSLGMLEDAKNRQLGVGADLMFLPSGGSLFAGLSGNPLRIEIGDVIRKLPHVETVSPVVSRLNTSGAVEVIYGIDLASFEKLGAFRYLAGGPFQGPYDVLVDDYFASQKQVKVGDSIEIFDHQFRISGIVLNGKGARKFVQLPTMLSLIGGKGASLFYVKADNPANAETVKREILSLPGMEGYKILTMQEYLSMMSSDKIPGFSIFIKVVIGIALTIGFIVIFQAMYTAVMERTREIGILKSLGASRLYIMNVILRETLLLAICGIVLGIAISYVARAGILTKFPLQPIKMSVEWILNATVIAIIGAALGALYPAFKAARKDPIDALAYE